MPSCVELTRSLSHPPSSSATLESSFSLPGGDADAAGVPRHRDSSSTFRRNPTPEGRSGGGGRIPHRRRNSLTGFRYSSSAGGGDDPVTHRRPNSLTEVGDVGFGFAHRRHSNFSYFRLAEDPFLRLSVLKLDGSSYDVQVAKTARVWELKIAIEDSFRQRSDDKDENPDISWSHVWSHFCLRYDDFKLTDDKAYIKTFGIKDGDQLEFIRHLSLNQGGSNTSDRKWKGEKHRMSFTRRRVPNKYYQLKSSQGAGYNLVLDEDDDDEPYDDYNKIEYCDKIDDCSKLDDYNKIGHANLSIGQLFREVFSYTRVRTAFRKKI